MLSAVSPRDRITVSMQFAQSGQMTVQAADTTSGTISKYAFSGPMGESWTEAVIGAIPSTSTPSRPEVIGSFSGVRLTPAGGTAAVLTKGPWTVQPVIDTNDGQSVGQIVANPTTIKNNTFNVIQQP